MYLEVMCKACKEPHLDHYECSECHANMGLVKPTGYKFCPYCGSGLTLRAADKTCTCDIEYEGVPMFRLEDCPVHGAPTDNTKN